MIFEMNLRPRYFESIARGEKKYELRLWDERRRPIRPGDEIVFTCDGAPLRTLSVKVEELFTFPDFDELYRTIDLSQCGYTQEELPTASPRDMETFYPPEKIRKYGTVAIRISLKKQEPLPFSPEKELKALFFDVDDTLLDFDFFVRDCLVRGFERFGLGMCPPDAAQVFHRINGDLWRSLERGERTIDDVHEERFRLVLPALGVDFDGDVFEKYFCESLMSAAFIEPAAAETLAKLSGRYLLCAASNGPTRQQISRLTLSGLMPFFAHLFTSEELGADKPSSAFFERCLDRLNRGREEPIRPEQILMIGDSYTSDVAGGNRFGLHTCLYRRHDPHRPSDDPDFIPDASVDSLPALLPLLLPDARA